MSTPIHGGGGRVDQDGYPAAEAQYGGPYLGGSSIGSVPSAPSMGLVNHVTSPLLTSIALSAGVWFDFLEQLSQKQDECPIPGTTPERRTKGNTNIESKQGDFDTENGDFDALSPGDVSDKGGGVRVGTLDDGRIIIVRPVSSDGSPTIEIQSGSRTRVKVRYVK